MENNEAKKRGKKIIMQDKNRLKKLSYSIKYNTICITGTQNKKREKVAEILFEEIIAEIFPKLWKEKYIQTQEAQRTPIKINKRKLTPRNILIKLAKYSDKKNFKAARQKKTVIYKGKPTKLPEDFSRR